MNPQEIIIIRYVQFLRNLSKSHFQLGVKGSIDTVNKIYYKGTDYTTICEI